MPYCTVDDVQALIPTNIWNHDGSNPEPSSTDVEDDYIPDIDAEIDSKLAGRYGTPITGAEALKVVNSIATRLVAIRVWGIVFTGQTGETGIPEDWKRAVTLLNDLAAGKADLTDAAAIGEQTAAHAGSPEMTMRDLREDPLQDEVMDPTFTRDQDF